MCALLLPGAVACTDSSGNSGGEGGGIDSLEFWSAPATEKILQDQPDLYEDIKRAAAVNVTAARGEYESGQILMTAEEDTVVDVEFSGLRSASGEEFSKENITVYFEKYIYVGNNYEGTSAPTGWYPDALVPFENVKARGENKVAAGQNQGLYVTFNVPLDCEPGTYTGEIVISATGGEERVSVALNVLDVEVSAERHAKNIFLAEWHYSMGELNSSQEMLDRYVEALFEYRLSPNIVVTDTVHSDEDIAFYTDLAYEYMQDVRCSNITIPYATATIDGQTCIDPVVFEKYLMSFARKSLETGLNMFDKSVCYFSIIDEPQNFGILERVKVVTRVYRETLQSVSEQIADLEGDTALKEALAESVLDIKNVVTASYSDAYAPYVETWCPQVSYYDTESGRAMYAAQEEKWWYTCISPRAPYPTYHTEDTLLSARALGWMQAQYDVVGNLFWAVNIYAQYDGATYHPIEDYYTGNAMRFPQVNGDGYLFYPGQQYGLEEPVGSLRLHAIRDGLEEYELLYALKEKYTETAASCGYAFDATEAIEGLTEQIYSGTRVSTDSERFLAARSSLLQLAQLSQSAADFAVVDYEDDGYGNVTYRFYANDNSIVSCDGEVLTGTQLNGGKLYTVKKKLDQEENVLRVEVTVEGETLVYTQALGGKVTVNRAEDSREEDFSEEGVNPVISVGKWSDIGLTGAKVELPASADGISQSLRISGSLISGIGEGTDRVILHIYSEEDGLPFIVSAKHSLSGPYVDMISTELHKGLNSVEISVGQKNWARLGDIEYIVLYFGGSLGEPARTVYIEDIVLYAG